MGTKQRIRLFLYGWNGTTTLAISPLYRFRLGSAEDRVHTAAVVIYFSGNRGKNFSRVRPLWVGNRLLQCTIRRSASGELKPECVATAGQISQNFA